MRCFVCKKKIHFWQSKTRIPNKAMQQILAMGMLEKPENGGFAHTDCMLSLLYEQYDTIQVDIQAIKHAIMRIEHKLDNS